MTIYVGVGDIHGELEKFLLLMSKLEEEVDFNTARIICTGDYVDGGKETYEVVSRLMLYEKKYPHWKFLRGNHEQMLLDAVVNNPGHMPSFFHWYNQGGAETVESYLKSHNLSAYDSATAQPKDVIHETHLRWFENLDYYYETPNFFFVHAGVVPGREPKETSQQDMLWIRDQFITSPYDWGKKIIFGHTVQRNGQPLVMENKIGLDTMHHGYGEISAVILDEDNPGWHKIVQSNGEIKHD